ncbi:MAG: hypothetical protein HPAVJP_0700 [Candidatus Hepatoplasma vulgare]|nr:MAG: hypothetical protein HPAVJP_0700 [Candidatus Hepatoplasma sp.]
MQKFYNFEITFKVNKIDQTDFLKNLKTIKNELTNKNVLPIYITLFKNIDKNKDFFTIYLGFMSDKGFDEWKKNVPQELKNIYNNNLKKYVIKTDHKEQQSID